MQFPYVKSILEITILQTVVISSSLIVDQNQMSLKYSLLITVIKFIISKETWMRMVMLCLSLVVIIGKSRGIRKET